MCAILAEGIKRNFFLNVIFNNFDWWFKGRFHLNAFLC